MIQFLKVLRELFHNVRNAHSSTSAWVWSMRAAIVFIFAPACRRLSDVLKVLGLHHRNWNPLYRLYSEGRVDTDAMSEEVIRQSTHYPYEKETLVLAIDDTHAKRTGKKLPL